MLLSHIRHFCIEQPLKKRQVVAGSFVLLVRGKVPQRLEGGAREKMGVHTQRQVSNQWRKYREECRQAFPHPLIQFTLAEQLSCPKLEMSPPLPPPPPPGSFVPGFKVAQVAYRHMFIFSPPSSPSQIYSHKVQKAKKLPYFSVY